MAAAISTDRRAAEDVVAMNNGCVRLFEHQLT